MKSVVLSGFPGTGKTTLAPLVAARLGLPFLDTDDELARRSGARVADLWRAQGETAFRDLEEEVVRELLDSKVARVLAFGGGTVTIRNIRRQALARAFVVTLASSPDVIRSRLRDVAERPALAARDPLGRIHTLLQQRADAYAECHLCLRTDTLLPDDAARRIAEESRRTRIVVPLGIRTYSIEVVADAPITLTEALAATSPTSVIAVTDANVRTARGSALDATLVALGVPVVMVTLATGEENKTLATVESIWDAAIAAHADRDATVLAFGGGVVGDLAGFAASTLLRGVELVQAPTSLLAMVDASVGGKTGFDLPAGKNLVGSFHQPAAVVVDVAHLSTLSERDFVSGLAEVVKVALACDASLWGDLESSVDLLAARDPETLARIIERAIARKATVVADDEHERDARKLLNLGHTVGHALEAATAYRRYRHGEAVALGLVAECVVAQRLGLAPGDLAARVRALLVRMRLPTDLSATETAAAFDHVAHDKKRQGDSVFLPLLRNVGDARVERVSLRDFARCVGVGDPG